MDLLKILRSFEELLFEAMTWLYFYPRTMLRIVARPMATMAYSDREEGQPEGERYDDSLSPPVLLIITLVIANAVGWVTHVAQPANASALAKMLYDSPQNLLMFRCLLFGMTPLVVALTLLRKKGMAVSRKTLRRPFYAQCYLASPVALAVSLGLMAIQRNTPGFVGLGLAVILASTAWLLLTETRWLAGHLKISLPCAAAMAAAAIARALFYMLLTLLPLALV
ncbi:hypothetical protein [Caulobacter endophyticus]|uniref:Permease n=1 Tax=Caulobacter endophyticus TaxID=2172652 RepID=A0A2T9KDW4_9CAUL|nr:hypothetical protein [Caulobacter endophyticus]PVM94171.1 hypothetical protein DDF67_00450 [Caulobacter endophyticus]